MASARTAGARGLGLLMAITLGAGVPAAPAAAQDDARLRRLEAEIRALQRAVFPGGDGRYFTPEVDTSKPQAPPPAQPAASSGGAVTDILVRLDALESQLARLTARSEENAYALGQLQERVEAAESAAAAAAAPPPPPPPPPSGVITPPGTSAAVIPAPTPAPAATATPAPSPQRVAAVQAIAKPDTGDAGEDEYTYGFRLWEAGFYPEAQQQLALYVERHPSHSRISFGRNLLGRAYLDNGQPREAATHFFENYQADRQAARAPDSLLFLAEAMVAIDDTNRACIALAEFGDTYPALATGRLKEQYDRNRARVSCG